jgi:hypothetical protein
MGTNGKKFGSVGGIKVQQRLEKRHSGWMGVKMSYPTQSFRETSDTAKAPLCFLDIIG